MYFDHNTNSNDGYVFLVAYLDPSHYSDKESKVRIIKGEKNNFMKFFTYGGGRRGVHFTFKMCKSHAVLLLFKML